MKVYTCFCTDIIHEGHMNIIREAAKLGDLTVGVLSDDQMISYNRFPTKTTEERIGMIRDIPGVKNVIEQKHIMYDEVVQELRPDYIVHGDNWGDSAMKAIRANIVKLLDKFGGKLVEIPYTHNESVEKLDRQMREKLAALGMKVSPMESPAPYVRFFFVKDPAGVTVQFM